MKKPQFVLSRKNQKGQVAIFVALIFQILFVFFAILINVGLLVHHKINLQQSADLAAYYGAMKQAESLNAIAHINFQIRQAWKLLAWRYRIVGTFGFQKASNTQAQPFFPVELKYGTQSSTINTADDVINNGCPVGTDRISTATHPFFCISHGGMLGWRGGQNAEDENGCKINCNIMTTAIPVTVNAVPNLTVIRDNGVSGSIAGAIVNVNNQLEGLCKSVGNANMNVLAKMIVSYRREMMMRSHTLMMLAGNLSNEKLLDLDGNEVVKGAQNTFRNNLTEANLDSGTSLGFKTYNSLSDPRCAMKQDLALAGNKAETGEFLKRIEFNLIEFFIHDCLWVAGNPGRQEFRSGRIYNSGLSDLADGTNSSLTLNSNSNLPKALRDEILRLVQLDNDKYTIGYEKNPWCPAYYVVSASSEPMIPFLPLLKIKLNAKAVAKPFGGTIGPWYGRKWDSGAKNTQDGITFNDQNLQLDENLPVAANIGSVVTKTQFARLLPNFSRFVGDTLGLSDPAYIAEYHAALITRKPDSNPAPFSTSKAADPGTATLSQPKAWPAMASWDNAFDVNSNSYDPLTKEPNDRDSYLRDLEISAMAPNQFDLSYYSIDPDFYNNYYLRLSNSSIFSKLKQSAQMGPDSVSFVRPDFGHSKNVYNKTDFSVRHQMEIVKKTIGTNGSGLPGVKPNMLEAFPYLITNQSSLLTGWTFKNFTDFDTFPKDDINSPDGTMAFGRCRDDWQKESGSPPGYGSPVDTPPLPPTPGNCVTGGRVGYSVKLVSPALLRATSPDQPLGGPGTSGKILNPIPADFLN